MSDQRHQSGALQLVEAFTIFEAYSGAWSITHCEHDVMYVDVDPNTVSPQDIERLEELGFDINEDEMEGFSSYKHGSC